MNRYDAAWPKGRATRRGPEPRPVEAAPGTARDALYAERYTVLNDAGGELGTVEITTDTTPPVEPPAVQDAIDDETPPDAR